MAHTSEHIFDAGFENFDELVLDAPQDQLVLVDFWASWCAPCRMLAPVLEQVVEQYGGRVALAKVDVDRNPQLAAQFGVQGIPAVKIFRGGEMVSEFTGALPELEIRSIVDRFLPSESDNRAAGAMEALHAGRMDEAKAAFEAILNEDPANSKANLGMAEIRLAEGDAGGAEEYAKKVGLSSDDHEAAENLLNRVQFIRHADEMGGPEACRERAQRDENDLDARFGLACGLAAREQYAEALEEFLAIQKKNKKYQDGAARAAMVNIFNIIGARSDLANEYRKKLEWVLY